MRVGWLARLVDAGRQFMSKWRFGSTQAFTDHSVAQPGAMADSASARAATANRRGEWCLSVILLLAACAFSGWLAYPNQIQPLPNGGLVVEDEDLDFGEASEERAFPWTIRIQNVSATPVTIDRFHLGCSCARVVPATITLAPGEKRRLDLVLDLTQGVDRHAASSQSIFSTTIYPVVHGSMLPIHPGWSIRGIVRRVCAVSDTMVVFDEPIIKGLAPPTKTIHLLLNRPVTEFRVSCDNRYIRAAVKRPHDASTTADLFLQVNPDAPAGFFEFEMFVDLVGDTGRVLSSLTVPVRGRVHDAVVAIPHAVYLGLQEVGNVVSTRVCIHSPIGASFVAEDGTVTDKDVIVGEFHDDHSRDISVCISSIGHRQMTVVLTAFLPVENRRVLLPVDIHYYGLARSQSGGKK